MLPVKSALADSVLAAGVGVPALDESLARTSRVVGPYVTGVDASVGAECTENGSARREP